MKLKSVLESIFSRILFMVTHFLFQNNMTMTIVRVKSLLLYKSSIEHSLSVCLLSSGYRYRYEGNLPGRWSSIPVPNLVVKIIGHSSCQYNNKVLSCLRMVSFLPGNSRLCNLFIIWRLKNENNYRYFWVKRTLRYGLWPFFRYYITRPLCLESEKYLDFIGLNLKWKLIILTYRTRSYCLFQNS